MPQPSLIYLRYARLVKYLKIYQCNPSCQHVKEEKSYDYINWGRKIIWQNPTVNHDKIFLHNSNKGKTLPFDKKKIYKNPPVDRVLNCERLDTLPPILGRSQRLLSCAY